MMGLGFQPVRWQVTLEKNVSVLTTQFERGFFKGADALAQTFNYFPIWFATDFKWALVLMGYHQGASRN